LGRKKRNIVLEKIELTDAGSLGKSISKKEGEKIIFTKNGVPGDIVDIRVRKKRKSYLEGDIIKYHKYSYSTGAKILSSIYFWRSSYPYNRL